MVCDEPEYHIPAFFVKTAVEKIVAQHGYKLSHKLDNQWDNLVIPVSSTKVGKTNN